MRDPNSMKTLESFDGAVEWALSGTFTQQDIDEAKLSIFQKVDGPVPPGDRGMRNFLLDVDDTMLANHRHELFAVDHNSLLNAANRYLSQSERTSSVSFLGPENTTTTSSSEWKVKAQ